RKTPRVQARYRPVRAPRRIIPSNPSVSLHNLAALQCAALMLCARQTNLPICGIRMGMRSIHRAGDLLNAFDFVRSISSTEPREGGVVYRCRLLWLWLGAIATAIAKGGNILGELLQAGIEHIVHSPGRRCVAGRPTGERCHGLIG